MTDEEFSEIAARYGWKTSDPIPRGMLLETLMPAVKALFGTEYAKLEVAEAEKK